MILKMPEQFYCLLLVSLLLTALTPPVTAWPKDAHTEGYCASFPNSASATVPLYLDNDLGGKIYITAMGRCYKPGLVFPDGSMFKHVPYLPLSVM